MEALLSYRLPDWGYRTMRLRLGLTGNGSKTSGCTYCTDQTAAMSSETLALQWYRESEQRVWSVFGRQDGLWAWAQDDQEPENEIDSHLVGRVFVAADSRHYLAGDVFITGNASGEGRYEEGRARVGAESNVSVARTFSGSVSLGPGLGRMRDVTPLLQAQRLSERLQALGRPPLSEEDVLRLASV